MRESPENLYYRDDALTTKPAILIWAPLITATMWSCSQRSLLSAGGRLQLHLVAGIRGAQISITKAMYRSALSLNNYKVSGVLERESWEGVPGLRDT